MARGEDHADGALQPDLARQPMNATGQRGQPDARPGSAKVTFSEAMMRSQESAISAAGHGDAVDGGDDRLVEVKARGEARKAALVPAAFPGGLRFQIVAGAKCLVAGAGDDRDPLLGVRGEIVKNPVELEMRINMQRVVKLPGATG